MKKMLIVLLAFACSLSTAIAQDGNGAPRDGGKMREMMKERLKTELKLTDVQADSVVAIQQEFMMKNRALRNNTDLTDDAKKTKQQELNAERKVRMKSVLSDEQITRLDEMNENLRKARQQRQGSN